MVQKFYPGGMSGGGGGGGEGGVGGGGNHQTKSRILGPFFLLSLMVTSLRLFELEP